MSDQATMTKPGKCAQLHAMWLEAGQGDLLPRAFAVEMAIAHGFNSSTARTQYQVMFRDHQLRQVNVPQTAHEQLQPARLPTGQITVDLISHPKESSQVPSELP